MDKRFCVYFHKNHLTDEIFYIGKGTASRPYSRTSRGSKWKEYVSQNESKFTVEIYKSGLSDKEALSLESQLIQSGDYPNIVNSITSTTVKENLLDVVSNFYYDETSPTFLRWKIKPRCKPISVGSVAGSRRQGDYSKVMLKKKSYHVHRLVWVLHNGEIGDGLVINHIDSNKSNNSIKNLEAITQTQNLRRTIKHLDKDSEVGIYLSNSKWCASFKLNNKLTIKSFSKSVYGDSAKQMALDFREAMFVREDDKGLSDKLLADFSDRYDYKLERDFPLGVSFLGNRFKAYFAKNGRELSKYFSIKKLGYQVALDMAISCRAEMEINNDNRQ